MNSWTSHRQLTDETAAETNRYDYDAWLQIRSSTGTVTNPQTGKGLFSAYRREDDGLYGTHNRFYEADSGRWKSADPAEADLNLYRYVNNNPINNDDPSGLEGERTRHDLQLEYQERLMAVRRLEKQFAAESDPEMREYLQQSIATHLEIMEVLRSQAGIASGVLPSQATSDSRVSVESESRGQNSVAADSDRARPDLRRMLQQMDDLIRRISAAERDRRYRDYAIASDNWAAGTGAPGARPTGRIAYREMGLSERVWRKELGYLLVRIADAEQQLGTSVEEILSTGSVSPYSPGWTDAINSYLETPATPGAPDEFIGKATGRAVRDIARALRAVVTDLPGVARDLDSTLMDFEEDPEAFIAGLSAAFEERAHYLGRGDAQFGYNQLLAEMAAGEILGMTAATLRPASALKALRATRLRRATIQRLQDAVGEGATTSGMALNVVEGSQTAPARFVRTVKPGERIADLIAEGKSATWVNEAEHAIVSLAGKGKIQRVVVSGGRDGIQFIERNGKLFFEMDGQLVQVRRVIGHTHPRATGPSQGDLDVLGILGQRRSYIIEIGGEPGGTVIRPK